MAITTGQLTAAIEGLSQLGVDTSAAAGLDLTDLPADAVVGEDVLALVAVFWPPAAIAEAVLAVAIEIASVARINVAPDPLPMTDAQTAQSRSGRNG